MVSLHLYTGRILLGVFLHMRKSINTRPSIIVVLQTRLLFRVIADQRVEVRTAAQQALSGLIHCGLIAVTDEMLNKTKRKLNKTSRQLRDRRAARRALLEVKHTASKNDVTQEGNLGELPSKVKLSNLSSGLGKSPEKIIWNGNI